MGILSGSLLGCGGPNHSALCDKALGEAHSAGERKDYKQAAQFLDMASKEADLSDSATEKSQVFQDQVALCNAQNDFAGAERYATQLLAFEQKQEHAEKDTVAWKIIWAEHIARADILLGDALKAQGKKKEALEVYKAAIETIKRCNASTPLETTVSERYVETLQTLGTSTGSLITDPAAIAVTVEDYNDTRQEMYDYRSHKQWANVVTSAEKVAKAAAQCHQVDAGVSAYYSAAAAEYFLGSNKKAREFAKQGISLANAHPQDATAKLSSADAWLVLAIAEDDPALARKDADTAYEIHGGHAEARRGDLLANVDASKWNQLFDWLNELRIPALRRQPVPMRIDIWQAWINENLEKRRMKEGFAWLAKMSASKRLNQQDIADCNDVLLQQKSSVLEISPQELHRRAVQNVHFREGLRKHSPDDKWNLAYLALDYKALGQNDKALAIATAAQKGVDPKDPLFKLLSKSTAAGAAEQQKDN
jgi:hypothetical protein